MPAQRQRSGRTPLAKQTQQEELKKKRDKEDQVIAVRSELEAAWRPCRLLLGPQLSL